MSDDHGYERDNHLSRRSGNYNGRRKFADTYRGSRDRGEYREVEKGLITEKEKGSITEIILDLETVTMIGAEEEM